MTLQELNIWVTTLCIVVIIVTVSTLGVMGYRKLFKDSELLMDIQMGLSISQIIVAVTLFGMAAWSMQLQYNFL